MTFRLPMRNLLAAAACAGVTVSATAGAVLQPTLSISASPDPATVGAPLVLSVLASNVSNLYGWQFSLAFNPSVLQAVSVTEGSFLSGGGFTNFGPGTINNTTGRIGFVFDSLSGQVPGVTGSGVLATIAFTVPQAGSSALTFSDVLFLDSALSTISVQVQNRTLIANVVPEPSAALLMALGLAGLALRRRLLPTA